MAAAEKEAVSLLPRRARRGSTWFGRLGDIVQQPPVWAGLAALLAVGGGPRGKRAAVRGAACYSLAAVVANLVIKPVVGRSRPPGSGEGRPGPVTSSFPSGHTATDLAFSLAVSQEMPTLFIPLTAATMAAHWSMVRSRGHYASDVLVGGVVGIVVALTAWRLWPPGPTAAGAPNRGQGGRGAGHDAQGRAHERS
ncbi:MAG TPA: phosphatase PAP2 family protein [Acidimicrobiales bacterium]|nr:phosphatase PAP2 family protein [Acidimicrobiales bacterium]